MSDKHTCHACGESCGGLTSIVWFLGTRAVRCKACGKVFCERCANKANSGRIVNKCPDCQGALDVLFG